VYTGLGVTQLERLLEPIPDGSAIVLLADPGLEAEPFLYQSAHAALKEGRDVVYVVTNRSPESALSAMSEYGFSPDGARGRLHVMDAFSALMGAATSSAYNVAKPQEAAEIVRALRRAAGEHPGALLVFDSLSTVVDNATPERFLESATALHEAMRAFSASVSVFTKWPYSLAVMDELSRFDATVSLRAVEDRVVVSQYFRLERVAWKSAPETEPRLYRTVKPGGVFVYIPKVVVTGPFNAGKSTFIRSLSDASVSVDHMGTTVALDHGRVTMDGLTAELFGTPGQARFDPILRVIAGQAVGLILVVDSTRPDTFGRAREMLEQTWRQGIPAVVAANKQDAVEAMTPSEVLAALKPPPGVGVVGCVGTDRESARRALRMLIDMVLQRRVPA
jgi:small GTP-binding protein